MNFTTTSRTGYIGMERDSELGLAEHGVRKYDEAIGRFVTPDALWEKYVGWSPYQYSLNNPVMFQDGNGEYPVKTKSMMGGNKWDVFQNALNVMASTKTGKIFVDMFNNAKYPVYINDKKLSSTKNKYIVGEVKWPETRGNKILKMDLNLDFEKFENLDSELIIETIIEEVIHTLQFDVHNNTEELHKYIDEKQKESKEIEEYEELPIEKEAKATVKQIIKEVKENKK